MRYATLVLTLVLGGCATPYGATGPLGGYNHTQLAPDVFRVMFSGNAFTSPEQTQDFAFLRAAELCVENGFSHFTVVDAQSGGANAYITTPGSANTYGAVTAYGNTATYSGHTTYTPPQTYAFYKPASGLLIRGFKERPEGIYAFDAAFLVKTLKEKYGVQ